MEVRLVRRTTDLPDEVLLQVFHDVILNRELEADAIRDLVRCSAVCKRWQVAKDDTLWSALYFARWTTDDEDSSEISAARSRQYSRHIYSLAQLAGASAGALHDISQLLLSGGGGSSMFSQKACSTTTFYEEFRKRHSRDVAVLRKLRHAVLQPYDQHDSAPCGRIYLAELIAQHGRESLNVLRALIAAQLRPARSATVEHENYVDWPSALSIYSPSAARSETHHLCILDLARDLTDHILRKQSIDVLKRVRQTHSVEPSLEQICAALSAFRSGDPEEMRVQLDLLAIACVLYLDRTGIPVHPVLSEDLNCNNQEAYKAHERQLALGITAFMREQGFVGPLPARFSDLDNSFLHMAMRRSNRETLPLLLCCIFCSIAERLGMSDVNACNAPGRMLVVIGVGSGRFWLDVYNGGRIFSLEELLGSLSSQGFVIPPGEINSFVEVASTTTIALRWGRNVNNSIERAQLMPRVVTVTNPPPLVSATVKESSPSDVHFLALLDTPAVPRILAASRVNILSPTYACPPRAAYWSEHEQNAAAYASLQAYARLESHSARRLVQYLLSTVQQGFIMDLPLLERDLLGAPMRMSTTNSDTGSDSSGDDDAWQLSSSTKDERQTSYLISDPAERHSHMMIFSRLRAADAQPPVGARRRKGDRLRASSPAADEAETVEQEAVGRDPAYPVGQILTHRVYGYKAVINSWDRRCESSEDWIRNMGVDSLPGGGREQPFYSCLVEDGTQRYVAEVNVIAAIPANPSPSYVRSSPISTSPVWEVPALTLSSEGDIAQLLMQRGLGRRFRCLDLGTATMRRSAEGTIAWPDR